MNAMTGFRLEAPLSSDLTRLDVNDEEAARDAQSALRRCASDADYAAWARQWGASLVRCALGNVKIARLASNTKRLRGQ